MLQLKKIMSMLWIVLIGFSLFFLLWKALAIRSESHSSSLVNQRLPSFSGFVFSNPHRTISEKEFHGQVILLNAFASWCSSCQAEHRTLMLIHRNEQITIYGLNYRDGKNEALQFLKQNGNPYDEIIDDAHGQIAVALGVHGVPQTFLIDSNGVIRAIFFGPINLSLWQKKIKPLIVKWRKGP